MEEKELRQLALDIAENKVFGTFHMNENEINHLHVVFMPFIGVDAKRAKEMSDNDIIHVYEYYDKAGPRSVNGMPCFFSMNQINQTDWKKIRQYIDEYRIKKNSFLDKKEVGPKVDDGPTLF